MINSFTGKYSFLSNFSKCLIQYDGIMYPTVEHAYQAQKTTDVTVKYGIAGLKTPAAAKRAGRKVKMIPNWDKIKVGIMYDLLLYKFGHVELAQKLLATGDEQLVEGNYWGDHYWGVCNGVGENMLGKLLMEVREKYKESLQSVTTITN